MNYLCIALGLLSASAEPRFRAKVNDPRPLKALVDEIQNQLQCLVHYEDAPIQYPGDTLDVTDQVQSPAQRAANPNTRSKCPEEER